MSSDRECFLGLLKEVMGMGHVCYRSGCVLYPVCGWLLYKVTSLFLAEKHLVGLAHDWRIYHRESEKR